MTDPRRTMHRIPAVRCRWCLKPYQPHTICGSAPTPDFTACMPESTESPREVDRDAETRTACPRCESCELCAGTGQVPVSVRASWRDRAGNPPSNHHADRKR